MAKADVADKQDLSLFDLVDALVEAIDIDRSDAVVRLREALEPFGAAGLFDDEIRLNGLGSSSDLDASCACGAWL